MLKEYFIQNNMQTISIFLLNDSQFIKKGIMLLFLLLLINMSWSKTIVCGKIEELQSSQVVRLAYFTNRIDYEEHSISTKITKDGSFQFDFELDQPRAFHLKYNGILSEEFFVAPYDSLVVETTLYNDLIELESGVDKFTSFRKPAHDYDEVLLSKAIHKWAKNPIEYFDEEKEELTPEKVYSSVFALYSSRLIDYRLAYDKIRFPLVAKNLLSEKRYPTLPKDYYSFIDTLNLNDVEFIETEEYEYLLMAYMHHQYTKHYPNGVENRFPIKYDLAEKLLKGRVKEFYQTVLLFNAIEQGYGAENYELLEKFIHIVEYPQYKEVLMNQQEDMKDYPPLVIGEKLPKVELIDINGYMTPLDRFKGKVIYLEFWASWCEPCIQQLPYTKEIREEYKDKELVFVYISLDEEEEDWRRMIEKKEIEGIHLHVNPSSQPDIDFINKCHVESVPTYFIIDKKGNLVTVNAPRPSDKQQLKVILDELI